MRISSIVVNWRQASLTHLAVDNLLTQTINIENIIVVDNGSNDGSVDALKSLPSPVRLLSSPINLGFGSACNIGIRAALECGSDFIFLLNNDATLSPTCLEELLKVMHSDKSMGLVGALNQDIHNSSIPHVGFYLNPYTLQPLPTCSFNTLNNSQYSWISASALLISSQALKNVGFFDPSFFMYWEDADLSHRFKKSGYRLGVATCAIVYHTPGTSSNHITNRRFIWHMQSQLLWLKKHYNPFAFGYFVFVLRSLAVAILKFDIHRLLIVLRLVFCRLA